MIIILKCFKFLIFNVLIIIGIKIIIFILILIVNTFFFRLLNYFFFIAKFKLIKIRFCWQRNFFPFTNSNTSFTIRLTLSFEWWYYFLIYITLWFTFLFLNVDWFLYLDISIWKSKWRSFIPLFYFFMLWLIHFIDIKIEFYPQFLLGRTCPTYLYFLFLWWAWWTRWSR